MSGSATILSSARPFRFAGVSRGTQAVALAAAVGVLLLFSQVSVEAFLWLSGAAFALAVVYPFVAWRQEGLDPGEAIYFFVLYYALSLLLRGLGLLTFVDSPYLTPIGDAQSPTFRSLLAWTFFYSAIGLGALYAGYRLQLPRRISPAHRTPEEALTADAMGWGGSWDRRRIGVAIVALFAIGLGGMAARVHAVGGFSAAASDPVATGTTEAVGRFWMIAMTEFAVVGFHVWVLSMILRRTRGRSGII